MFKTISTFAAVAALTVATIVPAHAALDTNGLSLNALTDNALTDNALDSNAITMNALTDNAITENGIVANGIATNGHDAGASTLTIQAIELPPETR